MGVTRPLSKKELTLRLSKARQLEQKMRQDRFGAMKTIRESIRRRAHLPRSVPSVMGVDSRGEYIRIGSRQKMKLELLDSGLVLMGTGLEQGWAGKRIIGGVPQRVSTLDIYSATRRAMEIQEGLEAGKQWRNEALPEIEKMNSMLYCFWDWGSPIWIYSYKGVLESLHAALENTINPLKTEAAEMLVKAAGLVAETSAAPNLSEKGKWAASACACLTAFRNRIGKWRDRQVEGMIAYNKMRERYLRSERDWRVWKALKRLVAVYSGERRWPIFGRGQKDLRYVQKLGEIASSPRKRAAKTEMIAGLAKEMGANKYSRGGRGFDLRLLDEAGKCYSLGQNEKGRRLLKRGMLILELDKPGFIAEQLNKAEAYMQPAAEKIGEGAMHLERIPSLPRKGPEREGALGAAVKSFSEALAEMEAIKR
ncbi:hypothetical protein GF412_05540 [Candidatus Micrarchaeota archaeon]|nr:hypothetical protein [Candidatus Micrarchaeota archaeon]MBD3418413.1 hypothetical protein [Candidatus Micrarchaeota archaeon]